jgi:inosine-uridine nucleoside N-ribohydrolase
MGGSQPTQAATIVGRILAGQADFIASGQYSFWDPLAATVARDDRLARLVSERISVIEEGPDSGRTLRNRAAPEIQVAVNADAAGFERTFVEALSARAP